MSPSWKNANSRNGRKKGSSPGVKKQLLNHLLSPKLAPSKPLIDAKTDIVPLARPALFSDEPEAIARREAVDYSIKISLADARAGKAPRVIRVYADGIYDLFHSEHARQLMQVKMAFPRCQIYLIVGCCSAELTHKLKGQTVMSENERYEMLRHCRYVDEVLRDAPWQTDMDFIRRYKIDFVAHDDIPYQTAGSEDLYKWLKDADLFLATQRTDGISTTDVITRIIRDYNTYIRRNLKRGYTRQDLNVGFVKEKELKIIDKFDSVRNRANYLLIYWEAKSVSFINHFIGMFNRNNRISKWLRHEK